MEHCVSAVPCGDDTRRLDAELAATGLDGLAGDTELVEGQRFQDLGDADRAWLVAVVRGNLEKTKAVNRNAPSSYGLKHVFERLDGPRYVSNLQMKVAMRICGFRQDADRLNPHYNVSKRSVDRLREKSRLLRSAERGA